VNSQNEVETLLGDAIAGDARLVKPAQNACCGRYHDNFKDSDGHLWETAYIFQVGPKDKLSQ